MSSLVARAAQLRHTTRPGTSAKSALSFIFSHHPPFVYLLAIHSALLYQCTYPLWDRRSTCRSSKHTLVDVMPNQLAEERPQSSEEEARARALALAVVLVDARSWKDVTWSDKKAGRWGVRRQRAEARTRRRNAAGGRYEHSGCMSMARRRAAARQATLGGR